MSLPKEGWAFWGEEGGHRLDVKRVAGGIEFTVISHDQEPVKVTVANFRIRQLKDWLRDEGDEALTWRDLYVREQEHLRIVNDANRELTMSLEGIMAQRNELVTENDILREILAQHIDAAEVTE